MNSQRQNNKNPTPQQRQNTTAIRVEDAQEEETVDGSRLGLTAVTKTAPSTMQKITLPRKKNSGRNSAISINQTEQV